MGDYYLFVRRWEGFTPEFPFDEFDCLRDEEISEPLRELAERWVDENLWAQPALRFLVKAPLNIEQVWRDANWIGSKHNNNGYPNAIQFFCKVESLERAQVIVTALQSRADPIDRLGYLPVERFDVAERNVIELEIRDNASLPFAARARRLEDITEEKPMIDVGLRDQEDAAGCSPRQRSILEKLCSRDAAEAAPCPARVFGDEEFGLTEKVVSDELRALKELGLVKSRSGRRGGWWLTEQGQSVARGTPPAG